MFDIITFGSASKDIFLKTKNIKAIKEKKVLVGEALCFSLGSKIDVENIYYFSGGGGTNTAATFSKQGFKTAYCGMIGNDTEGEEVINELKLLKIETSLIKKSGKEKTNTSVVINIPGKDRTILVYRGASEAMTKKDISFGKIKSKWIYLAPLSGHLSEITEVLLNHARKNGIKIAMNPGMSQLSFPKKRLEKILKKIDVLFLNQEEASILTGINYEDERGIFQKIDDLCDGISVMTKGPEGVVVSDGKYLYKARPFNSKVIDRTGAGDSFNSAFISGLIRSGNDIESSIQLGIANSTACLKMWGAKNGLIKKNQNFKKVIITKESCLGHNCKIK